MQRQLEPEIILKEKIIAVLKEDQEAINRHVPGKPKTPEQFIRGFIHGAETATGLNLLHFYDEIILRVTN